ncbi:MAG: hypothetical protein ABSF26_01210 [Thermoguttaceae bacterium]|jgi:hypothetical protein
MFRTAQRASKYSFRRASCGAPGGELLQPLAGMPQRLRLVLDRHAPPPKVLRQLQPPLDDFPGRVARAAIAQFLLPEPIGFDLHGGDHRRYGLHREDVKEEQHPGQRGGSVVCFHGGPLEGSFGAAGSGRLPVRPVPVVYPTVATG